MKTTNVKNNQIIQIVMVQAHIFVKWFETETKSKTVSDKY